MNSIKRWSLLFLLTAITGGSQIFSQESVDNKKTVQVIIDYGNLKPTRTTTVTWREGFTALQALQYAAAISTYPIGEYVFVTGIDSVNGEKGVMAWYYTVNDKPAHTLAINNKVMPGDKIKWIYKKDVCSEKKECSN